MEDYQIFKFKYQEIEIDLLSSIEEETVWLNQEQLINLYDTSKSNISEHLKNIFIENKLDKNRTVRNFRTLVSNNRNYNVKYYNLEVILLLDIKLKSKIGSLIKEQLEIFLKANNIKKKRFEIVKFIDNTVEIDVNVSPEEQTIWMTQKGIAKIFGVNVPAISKHLSNIFKEGELKKDEVVSKMENTPDNKEINLYNLDAIIAVGYRVNSNKATQFRMWATRVLRNYLINGYEINEKKLKESPDNLHNLINVVNKLESNQISIDNRLKNVEDKIYDYKIPINKILFNGEFYDAYTLIQSIFESATFEIIIIDNYINRKVLDRLTTKNKEVIDRLTTKNKEVIVNIYTDYKKTLLTNEDIEYFNKQYKNLKVRYTTKVHDRYIIIDKNKLYHIGSSLKDIGNKIFSISESNSELIEVLLEKI